MREMVQYEVFLYSKEQGFFRVDFFATEKAALEKLKEYAELGICGVVAEQKAYVIEQGLIPSWLDYKYFAEERLRLNSKGFETIAETYHLWEGQCWR